jgi:hypothetical protein
MKQTLFAVLIASSTLGSAASAQSAQSADSLEVRASASTDARLAVAYRHRFDSGVQLGVGVEGGYSWNAYVSGYVAGEQGIGVLYAESRFPVLTRERLRFQLLVNSGVRRIFGDDGQPTGSTGSWAIEARLGLMGHARVGDGALHLGVIVPFSIEVAPETIIDVQGALLSLGLGWPLSERVWIGGEVEAGGVFGADGNAQKFILRGSLNLRFLFGSTTESWWAF